MSTHAKAVDHLQLVLQERAPEIAEDPGMRPTLRVGGIGHRSIESADEAKVATMLAELLRLIRQSAETSLGTPLAAEGFRGSLELFAITPLAEGADRIFARTALEAGYGLGTIIPFAITDYESTFDLAPSREPAVAEFRALLAHAALPHGYGVLVLDGPSAAESKTLAYRDCSAAIVRWSDILIAVLRSDRWDSETGLTVRQAIARGLLVLIVDPRKPEAVRIARNGMLLPPESEVAVEIKSGLVAIFGVGGDQPRTRLRGLRSYRDETVSYDPEQPCDYEYIGPYRVQTVATPLISWCSGLNGLIAKGLRLMAPRHGARTSPTPNEQPKNAGNLPFDAHTAAPFVQLFLRHHRADAAASAYAELHRSAQILTVLLGVTAAALATAGSYVPTYSGAFTLLEIICLAYALFIVVSAHRQGWLERWLNYRLMAEVLRYAKFLLVCGHPMSFADFGQTSEATSTQHNWTYNHCRQVLRALRIAMPGRTETCTSATPHDVSAYLNDQCIDGQITYHWRTASLRSAVARLLQALAVIVALVTIACVIAKFVLEMTLPKSHSPFISAVDGAAILLPVIAGALLGLRGYGQHSIIGKRSGALVASLELKRDVLKQCSTVSQLGEQMSSTAGMLLRDVDGWLEIFSDKHIEL